MSNPQSPAVRRSEQVPALNPDATETVLTAEQRESPTDPTGPVPEDQQPGHHPDQDQDKPEPDAFAERLGILPDREPIDGRPADRDESGGAGSLPWKPLFVGAAVAGTAIGVARAVCTYRDRKR